MSENPDEAVVVTLFRSNPVSLAQPTRSVMTSALRMWDRRISSAMSA